MARWTISISSLDDPRIANYRHLKATNQTRGSREFVLEGEKLLDELLRSRYPVASVLALDREAERIAGRLPEEVPLYVLPQRLISELVGYNFHQGVLACGLRQDAPDLLGLVSAAGTRLTLVVCPRLDNPENLGSIIRLGDVFGVDALVVGGRCPDPLSRRVLRVSMGTSLRLPVLSVESLGPVWARLRGEFGVRFAAAVSRPDARAFDMVERSDRFALVLGCEGTGLEHEWEERSDWRITIPMRAGAESLNVSVAAGILLHHYTSVSG